MSSRRAAALLLAALLALAACSTGSGDATDGRDAPAHAGTSLRWRSCRNAECATLRVPLDPERPDGEQIDLALTRVRAGNPDERIGSLLFNPGGPGAPGSEFVEDAAAALPDEISDRFDVVAWDPRGTGQSSPVDCGNRLDYLFAPDSSPDNAAERAARQAAAARFAATCNQRSPSLIRNVATIDTVRDLERIRAALGEEQLNFLGLSYGTYIGALYAHTYPQRVRALVLDGAIDPALPIETVSIQQSKGFEASFDAFLADCAKDSDCAFHHDGKPKRAFDALRNRIERRPLRADGRRLGPTQLDVALTAPLYAGAEGYDDLAEALRDAERGDPSGMIEEFDDYVGRRSDGTYSPEWAAFLAISCADGPEIPPAALPGLEARAQRAAPTFGVSTIGLTLPCSYWPVPPVSPDPVPVAAPGAAPIVVIGTTEDPATPLVWARGLTRELGSARLITVDGTAHTSSLSDNPCLDDALVAYLVRLRPPARGLRCPA